MSIVNSGDILGALDLLVQVKQEELAQGRIVWLGHFGSFSLTLPSEGKARPEEVHAASVKDAKL